MATFKQKFNLKYKQDKNQSNSIEDIASLTGIKKSILQEVYERGYGASLSNPESVRQQGTFKKGKGIFKNRLSSEQWAFGRLYGFVMNNPKQVGQGKPDDDLMRKIKKKIIYK